MSYILFDVGAHHGEDSLNKVKYNPDVIAYAFEAVPEFYELIKKSSNEGTEWFHYAQPGPIGPSYADRYNIYHTAVSNYDGTADFYVANGFANGAGSLYKFKDNLHITWPGRDDFKLERVVNVPVTRLDTWYKTNNIQLDKIDYFHCDTQGSDLRVLQGMGDLVYLIQEGTVEVANNKEVSLYNENHTKEEMEDFLNEHGFEIFSRQSNDIWSNEINFYFKKK